MAKGSGGGGGVVKDRNIYGTIGNDVLGTRDKGTTFGFAGNDTIIGGAGFDVVHGGDGNDTIRVGAADDKVWGGLGSDFLDGGTGSDWVNYGNELGQGGVGATSGVTVNLDITTAQNTGGGGIDTIVGFENIGGSDFADLFTGLTNQTSTILGLGGNDSIIGGNVADSLYGMDGDDTVDGGAGNDNIEGNNGNDSLLGGAGSDSLRPDGDASPNIIGNDFIDGGLGVDMLSYYGDTFAGVTVNLSLLTAQNTGGGGTETILNVENVSGTTFNDTLTGNSVANFLWGGGGGADILSGLGGDDILQGDSNGSKLFGGNGNDGLYGGSDTLADGGAGNDTIVATGTLNGGAGNDKITGGAGSFVGSTFVPKGSTITGGTGADTFIFDSANSSADVGISKITDFSRLEGDKIDMHLLPANTGILAPLTYVGYAPFSSFSGHPEVRVVAGTGEQNVEIDLGGDRVADITIKVVGTTPLVASDFILA